MSRTKALLSCGLAAICLSACGSITHPRAGRGRVADVRPGYLQCLLGHHLPAVNVGSTGIQVGSPPAGPTIQFTPTYGAAQADQIENKEQGAEVIGTALLYPNQASDSELNTIENCLDQGVSG